MEAREKQIQYYLTRAGRAPFRSWLDSIRDKLARAAIEARLARLRTGNFGKCRSVGEGVSESKIDFGPGYRIYYGVGDDVIVLLLGGDKGSQASDISRAKSYWKDYKERAENAKRKGLQDRSSG